MLLQAQSTGRTCGRGERVLDLASGTGICALDAALRVGPEGAVVGVDLTNTMLAVVRFSTVGAQGAAPYDAPCYGDMAVCQQRLCRLVCMIRLAAEILQCVLQSACERVCRMLFVELAPPVQALEDKEPTPPAKSLAGAPKSGAAGVAQRPV